MLGGSATMIVVVGAAAGAAAGDECAPPANAGGTVSGATGDTLLVKLPGRWKLAGDTAPELTLGSTSFEGHGARGHTILTFSAADHGAVRLGVKNAITGVKLSMLVEVARAR